LTFQTETEELAVNGGKMPEGPLMFGPLFRQWCLLFMAATIVIAVCIRWLDVPIALAFLHNANRFKQVGTALGSAVLVSGQMLVIVTLAILRMTKGKLPAFAKAVFVACCASLCAFVVNDYVLKLFFGRRNPSALIYGLPDQIFHFFKGNQYSSFPSGHMVMATAFGFAFIRLQPRMTPAVLILLCIGASALIIGDWHFLGDVVAGTFLGGTAGFMAGNLWLEHEARHG
jgi:membrane-associated phospholipid phosphatase